MMNKIFSVVTFIFISFGFFGVIHLIQTSQDNKLDMKQLEKMVDREILEHSSKRKKHIDSH